MYGFRGSGWLGDADSHLLSFVDLLPPAVQTRVMVASTGMADVTRREPVDQEEHVQSERAATATSKGSADTKRWLCDEPLPVYNRGVLDAHHAEKVARAHLDEADMRMSAEGLRKMTRSKAALFKGKDGELARSRGGTATDRRHRKLALQEMFGIEPDTESDDGDESYHVDSSRDTDSIEEKAAAYVSTDHTLANNNNAVNYKTIERTVRRLVEPMLQLTDMVTYTKVEYWKQQD